MVYRPEISVEALDVKHVYRQIMNIVTDNHYLDDRISILTQLDFRLLFIHRSGYGIDINQGLVKKTYGIISKVGSLNFDQASFTCYPEESKPTHEKSYYIQISGSKLKHKDLPGKRITLFVEITENKLLKLTRKSKLKQLFV
jgi:hypothetical protein